jgi:hypothetical protein
LRVSDSLLFLAFLTVGVGVVRLMYNARTLARFVPAVFLESSVSR